MASHPVVPIQHSISTKLLKSVFSVYFLLTVTVTSIHMIVEYQHVREGILQELQTFGETFEPGLSISLYEMNIHHLDSTLAGLVKVPTVVGIKIVDEQGIDVSAAGLIRTQQGEQVRLDAAGNYQEEQRGADLFFHSFPLMQRASDKVIIVGEATLYSSSDVIIQKVRLGFMFIVANAIIKTIALWGIFLWIGERLLNRPLAALTEATGKLDLDNLGTTKIEVKNTGRDELKVLEMAFNSMIRKLATASAERKQATEALYQFKNYLHNIIDAMPSMLIGLDNVARITLWNAEAEKRTKLSESQTEGHPLGEIVPQLKHHMEIVDQTIHIQAPQKMEKVKSRWDEQDCYLDLTAYPITADGITGAVLRIDDVTHRVRLEEIMVQTEKMMSVGGLAAGMAHEINNPLSAILQNVQMLDSRLTPKLPKTQERAKAYGIDLPALSDYMEQQKVFEYLGRIRRASKRAAHIVDNMLQFSRSSDSQKRAVSLEQLVENAVDLASKDYDLKKAYDFGQVRIVRELDATCPPVPCVAVEIEQVLLNLLKNAAYAMSTHPSESAEPIEPAESTEPRIYIRTQCEATTVQIEVEDTGPGMDEEIRRRIFEPFFTTKAIGQGTGLGLSVSYFIITNNHQGTIDVESQPGQGSTFIIHLPLTPATSDKELHGA